MALEILNAKKVVDNGLLSKIQIGGKTYEIKDLIARENLQALALLIDALELNKADKEQVTKDIAAAIAGKADKDQVALDIAAAIADKATKTQVAADIKAAVDAEAALREAADNALDGRLDKIELFFEGAAEDSEGLNDALDTLKEIQNFINTDGTTADAMVKDIAANKKAIEDEVKARGEADSAMDERLKDVEALLTGGEGSVGEQIEAAKDAAVEAAKGYTDGEIDKVEAELAKKEDKANLKALAYKDSAAGTVAGQTISGVKATGTSAGSITVELQQSEHAMNSTGKFTPVGNVTGTVKPTGSVAVTVSTSAADATLTKGDYTPAGSVSVALSGNSFNAITGVGTQATFTEGEFTPASLDKTDVTANYATEGLVGTVEDECLTFTAAGIAAITASKVNSFDGGAKAADTFVANSLPTMAAQTVGVQSASFTGTLAEDLVVTKVSYAKANAEAAATFTGDTNDIAATFAGTEGDIAVAGKCHDYAVKTAEFNGAAIELAVGDIVVAEKNVTVQ